MTELSAGLRSTFAWERRDGVMVITDLDDGTLQLVKCSVIDDAHNIIRYLVKVAGLRDGEPVIYWDRTQERWDEMTHQAGRHVNFASIGSHSVEAAILVARKEHGLDKD